MIPGKDKQPLVAGDLAWSYLSPLQTHQKANAFVEYMTHPEVMQKYYDVDGSPATIEERSNKREDSPLCWDDQICLYGSSLGCSLQQYWTSEADFHTMTMNYVLTGDKQGMV